MTTTFTIKFPCFCGGEICLNKNVGGVQHFTCSNDTHFGFSVKDSPVDGPDAIANPNVITFSARVSDKISYHFYSELDYNRLVYNNQGIKGLQMISNLEDVKLFCNNPVTYIQNHLILA